MATIEVTPTTLHIRYTPVEKMGGLLRDLAVPRALVDSVSVEPDGLAAAEGIRAPGLAIPGRRKIGTWRGRGQRTAVSVRRGEPAVRVRLRGHKFSQLLISAPDAPQIAESFSDAALGRNT